MIDEEWRDVTGFEGIYEVSNKGRVRSLDRMVKTSKSKTGYYFRKGVIMKTFLTGEKRNYPSVQLKLDGEHFNKKIHRLVAEEFIPNPDLKEEVNHKDGNTQNNMVDNLEWCTPSENMQHAFKNKLLVRGSGINIHNLKYIVNVYEDNVLIKTLAGAKEMRAFGLIPDKVVACLNGKRKTHRGYTYSKVDILH